LLVKAVFVRGRALMRMQGRVLDKARCGEIRSALPVGFLYDGSCKMMKDTGI